MEPVPSGRDRSRFLNRRRLGAEQEQRARRYLERAGLQWFASNMNFRGGELDLIMRNGACWVFVEVRYRHDARYGGALASITRLKQQKLLRAAAFGWRSAAAVSIRWIAVSTSSPLPVRRWNGCRMPLMQTFRTRWSCAGQN